MTHPLGVVDGTFAGTNPHDSYTLQLNELGRDHIPALVELPDIGPHARGIGKLTGSLELPVERRPYGWQLQRGTRINSADQLRAISHRDSIIQALSDVAAEDAVPHLAVRLAGPVTLLTEAMLPGGQRILRDPGARQDVAAAWTAGVSTLISKIHAVLGSHVTLIVREHRAQDVADGKIRTVSGADLERAVDVSEIRSYWQAIDALDADVLLDTAPTMRCTAAEVTSVLTTWPMQRNAETEQTWETIDTLLGQERPVGFVLTPRSNPERYAEELVEQYLEWGLNPAGLEYLRFIRSFQYASQRSAGAGLEWLRTVAEHAGGYATTR